MRLFLLVPLALALVACEGGGKPTTGATESGSSTTASTTEGGSAGTTSGATSTSTGTSDGTAEPTTDATTSTDPPVCSTLGEIECALAEHCMSIIGDPLNFPGCMPGPTFLSCSDVVPCDAVITTVCSVDSNESYQLQSGCIPPGFMQCEPDLGPCGADCLGLDEQACLADDACVAFFGAPHTTKMGMECTDWNNQVFLACDVAGPACPPTITTVCPEDQPDTAFDTGGCVPPGFVPCMGDPLPDCP
jgi:hypothetical protein